MSKVQMTHSTLLTHRQAQGDTEFIECVRVMVSQPVLSEVEGSNHDFDVAVEVRRHA